MEVLSTYSNYQQFKQILDAVMIRAVEDFVIIGYLLNEAATTDILLESGYANVNEFAKAEYGIDDSQVSRFIRIHKRFGIPGEPRLQEKYVKHGVKKLGIMLTLPDSLNEEISSEFSYSEIKAIKKEYEEEQKISDVEVAIEAKEMEESVQYTLPEGLKQAVCQLVHDKPQMYVRMYSCIELDDLKEVMAPMGENSFVVRIKGVGKVAIFLRANGNISVTNLRNGDKESYEWQQLFDALKEYFSMGGDAEASWSNVFKEPFPIEEKEEQVKSVEKIKGEAQKHDKHKVQQSKPKKETRVNVVTTKPKKEEPKPVEEPEKEIEEQLPGQMGITDFPDYLPESMKEDKPEVLTGEVVDAEDVTKDEENAEKPHEDNVQQSQDGMKIEYIAPVQDTGTEHVVKGLKKVLKASTDTLGVLVENEDWAMVISKATDIVHRTKKIMELEEKN